MVDEDIRSRRRAQFPDAIDGRRNAGEAGQELREARRKYHTRRSICTNPLLWLLHGRHGRIPPAASKEPDSSFANEHEVEDAFDGSVRC